jgi:hypothetical protein
MSAVALCLERQLAEIEQKPGESPADYVLRMAELNRPKGRRGSVRGMSRKNLVRRFGKMRKGSDPPLDPLHPAFVKFMRRKREEFEKDQALQWASWIATHRRFESDPDYREHFPWTPKPGETMQNFLRRQDRYMVKPWRGSAGRRSATENGTIARRKSARLAQLIEMLHADPNLKAADIVAKFGCSAKTADRYLKAAKKADISKLPRNAPQSCLLSLH